MVNSEVSFYKHVDKLLKVLDPAYELQGRTTLKAPGYCCYSFHEEAGEVEQQIKLIFVLDQQFLSSEKGAELRAKLERHKLLDMMGLLKSGKAQVQAGYQGLDAYMQTNLGTFALPKKRYVNNDGTAGNQMDICVMRIKLLSDKTTWEEMPGPKDPLDLRHFRIYLTLISYSM